MDLQHVHFAHRFASRAALRVLATAQGFYCSSGAWSPAPHVAEENPDGGSNSSGGLCPAGHYCPKGTAIPVACPEYGKTQYELAAAWPQSPLRKTRRHVIQPRLIEVRISLQGYKLAKPWREKRAGLRRVFTWTLLLEQHGNRPLRRRVLLQ